MAGTTAVAAARIPTGSDAPSAAGVSNMGQDLDKFVVGRFASTGARSTAIPSPVLDQVCMVAGFMYRWNGTAWVVVYGSGPEVVRTRASTSSVPTATWTVQTTDTTGTNNPGADLYPTGRGVVCVNAGRYEVIARATFGANATGRRLVSADRVAIGASSTGGGGTNLTAPPGGNLGSSSGGSAGSSTYQLQDRNRVDAAAGDILGCWVFQESGGALNVSSIIVDVFRVA